MRLTAPALLLALALGPAAACTEEPTEEVLLPSTLGPDRSTPVDGGFVDDSCLAPEDYLDALEQPPCDGSSIADAGVPSDEPAFADASIPPEEPPVADGSVPDPYR